MQKRVPGYSCSYIQRCKYGDTSQVTVCSSFVFTHAECAQVLSLSLEGIRGIFENFSREGGGGGVVGVCQKGVGGFRN